MIEDQDVLLRLIAKLYYIDDLRQNEIAAIVGISRSQISRLLTRAKEKGILRIYVDEYEPRDRELESELKSTFKLNHAFVFKTLPDATPDNIRRSIGYFGAPLVSEMLRPNTVIGVAGGRSLYELVKNMRPTAGTRGVGFVQLMGNIGPSISSEDAMELSHILAQRFHGPFYTVSAPIYVPNAESREVFLKHSDVSSVWKLYEMMNIALVGIGSLSDSFFIARNILSRKEIEDLKSRNSVGEICGHFLDANGQECDTDFKNRVVSIGLDELRGLQEVIGVVPNGARRVDAIHAAISSGLVTSLLIDDCAASLILDKEKEKLRGIYG